MSKIFRLINNQFEIDLDFELQFGIDFSFYSARYCLISLCELTHDENYEIIPEIKKFLNQLSLLNQDGKLDKDLKYILSSALILYYEHNTQETYEAYIGIIREAPLFGDAVEIQDIHLLGTTEDN